MELTEYYMNNILVKFSIRITQTMIEMSAHEFVRRLHTLMEHPESRFAFFLGSGCSTSSGIPSASTLVKRWFPRLKKLKTGTEENTESWIQKNFADYNDEKPSLYYSKLIELLFHSAEERQKEIEKLIEGKDPGFGYAVMAQLISHENFGKHFNVVLTTNFDDMVADALYLYTNTKPLVIHHEALMGYVRISRVRPALIKLHGDAKLSPKNTEEETLDLDERIKNKLRDFLLETGLIFVGYGGNDKSIVGILNQLDKKAIPWKVYWISDKKPENEFGEWLEKIHAVWVKHRDFDELMLLVKNEFKLRDPDKERFNKLLTTHDDTFRSLQEKIESKPENEEKKTLEKAIEETVKNADEWEVIFQLDKLKVISGSQSLALEKYVDAINKYPNNAFLVMDYAKLLEKHGDYVKAAEYYKKGFELRPTDEFTVMKYCRFLIYVLNDIDKTEEYLKIGMEKNPKSVTLVIDHADLLGYVRENIAKAEEYYKKGIEMDPSDYYGYVRYGRFCISLKRYDEAEKHLVHASTIDTDAPFAITTYANFLAYYSKDHDKAEKIFKQSISKKNNSNLSEYAKFLELIRKDYATASKYYQQSLSANPKDEFALIFYAGFLFVIGEHNKAMRLLRKAKLLTRAHSSDLVIAFYEYAHSTDNKVREDSLKTIKRLIQGGSRTMIRLEGNAEKAIIDKHPNPEFLRILYKVINLEEPRSKLLKFDIWNND